MGASQSRLPRGRIPSPFAEIAGVERMFCLEYSEGKLALVVSAHYWRVNGGVAINLWEGDGGRFRRLIFESFYRSRCFLIHELLERFLIRAQKKCKKDFHEALSEMRAQIQISFLEIS